MKRILITGADSYIGTSFQQWVSKPEFEGQYQVDTVDMRNEKWKTKDFSEYDAVFHVAGIAHVDIGKATEEQKMLYYKVNCDLAVDTAKKAKEEGVKQFIYMSSIIVYGEGTSVRKKKIITSEMKPSPSNFYGDSKWQAEKKLMPMSDEKFYVTILRPPMIYGKGSKGNYKILEKIALNFPAFPDFPNQRSILSIENLCQCVKSLIDNPNDGIYFPQNKKYIKTSDLVLQIASRNGKKVHLLKRMDWMIYLLSWMPGKIGKMTNKAFGSLVIDFDFKRFDG